MISWTWKLQVFAIEGEDFFGYKVNLKEKVLADFVRFMHQFGVFEPPEDIEVIVKDEGAMPESAQLAWVLV